MACNLVDVSNYTNIVLEITVIDASFLEIFYLAFDNCMASWS